jgi:hypothetical protein
MQTSDLHFNNKGRRMGRVKKFYSYKETVNLNQLNGKYKIQHDKLSEIIVQGESHMT